MEIELPWTATTRVAVEVLVESRRDATGPTAVNLSLGDVAVSFNGRTAVRHATFDIARQRVTSLIGPSGSGKTTLLRVLNRLHDRTPSAKIAAEILLDGTDIYGGNVTQTELRTRGHGLAAR